MTTARPDLFHPRIVFAGCPALPDGDGDDAGLVGALRRRGLHARWMSWDDPAALEADLVILRAAWDYTERLDEFLAWTRRVLRCALQRDEFEVTDTRPGYAPPEDLKEK